MSILAELTGCAFCKRTGIKMSREHVMPKWLSEAGAAIGGYYHMERAGKTIRTPLMEAVTKRICEDCNTGWLSRIETGAAPVFRSLLGQTAKIDQIRRWIIARWFSKTILTAQLGLTDRSGGGILHPKDYDTFYHHAQPFQNQFTFLCAYQGALPPIRFEIVSPDEETNRGVRAWFNFHQIVLMAAFMSIEEPMALRIPTAFNQLAHIIWPTQRELLWAGDPTLALSWPPFAALDETSIDVVRATFMQGP